MFLANLLSPSEGFLRAATNPSLVCGPATHQSHSSIIARKQFATRFLSPSMVCSVAGCIPSCVPSAFQSDANSIK